MENEENSAGKICFALSSKWIYGLPVGGGVPGAANGLTDAIVPNAP